MTSWPKRPEFIVFRGCEEIEPILGNIGDENIVEELLIDFSPNGRLNMLRYRYPQLGVVFFDVDRHNVGKMEKKFVQLYIPLLVAIALENIFPRVTVFCNGVELSLVELGPYIGIDFSTCDEHQVVLDGVEKGYYDNFEAKTSTTAAS